MPSNIDPILFYLLPLVAIIGFSLAASVIKRNGEFSTSTFFLSFSAGVLILIWVGILPLYVLLFNALLIGGIFISSYYGSD